MLVEYIGIAVLAHAVYLQKREEWISNWQTRNEIFVVNHSDGGESEQMPLLHRPDSFTHYGADHKGVVLPELFRKQPKLTVAEKIKHIREATISPNGDAISDLRKEHPDWFCPLSYDLMVKPVKAADGRIYEQAFFQEHIKTLQNRRANIISPWNRQSLSSIETSPVELKNIIETWVNAKFVEVVPQAQQLLQEAEKADAELQALTERTASAREATENDPNYEQTARMYAAISPMI